MSPRIVPALCPVGSAILGGASEVAGHTQLVAPAEVDDEAARLRRRSIRIVLMVWVPLLVLAAGVLVWRVDPFGVRPGCAPSPPAVADAAGPGWDGLADAPLPVIAGSAKAWTGDELVVYGGDAGIGRDTCPTAAGAAYDPSNGSWRRIADAPFAPLYQVQGLATPAGVFVTGQPCSSQRTPEDSIPGCEPGGLAAAMYDPQRDRWDEIGVTDDAFAGLPNEHVVYVLGWDGDQVVLRAPDRLLAYDPAADEWHRWPAPPTRFGDGLCVVDGGVVAVDVFRPDIIVDEVEDREDTSPTVSVSHAGSAWSAPISSGTGAGPSPAASPVCAGDDVLVIDVSFDSTTLRWTSVSPAPPQVGYFQGGQTAWTGDRLAIVTQNALSTYEPSTDAWAVLGPADAAGSWMPLWTGDALVYEDPDPSGRRVLVAVAVPS